MIDFDRYKYEAVVYDYSGNCSEFESYTDIIPPANPVISSLGYDFTGVYVYWNKQNDKSIGRVNIERKPTGNSTAEQTYKKAYVSGSSGTDSLGNYGWYRDNSGSHVHAVGGKLPNNLGMYDMFGNVSELCNDRWSNDNHFLCTTCRANQTRNGYVWNYCNVCGTKWERLRIGGDYGSAHDDGAVYNNGGGYKVANVGDLQQYYGMRLCRTVK